MGWSSVRHRLCASTWGVDRLRRWNGPGALGLAAGLRAHTRLVSATVVMAVPVLLFASSYFLQRSFRC